MNNLSFLENESDTDKSFYVEKITEALDDKDIRNILNVMLEEVSSRTKMFEPVSPHREYIIEMIQGLPTREYVKNKFGDEVFDLYVATLESLEANNPDVFDSVDEDSNVKLRSITQMRNILKYLDLACNEDQWDVYFQNNRKVRRSSSKKKGSLKKRPKWMIVDMDDVIVKCDKNKKKGYDIIEKHVDNDITRYFATSKETKKKAIQLQNIAKSIKKCQKLIKKRIKHVSVDVPTTMIKDRAIWYSCFTNAMDTCTRKWEKVLEKQYLKNEYADEDTMRVKLLNILRRQYVMCLRSEYCNKHDCSIKSTAFIQSVLNKQVKKTLLLKFSVVCKGMNNYTKAQIIDRIMKYFKSDKMAFKKIYKTL